MAAAELSAMLPALHTVQTMLTSTEGRRLSEGKPLRYRCRTHLRVPVVQHLVQQLVDQDKVALRGGVWYTGRQPTRRQLSHVLCPKGMLIACANPPALMARSTPSAQPQHICSTMDAP